MNAAGWLLVRAEGEEHRTWDKVWVQYCSGQYGKSEREREREMRSDETLADEENVYGKLKFFWDDQVKLRHHKESIEHNLSAATSSIAAIKASMSATRLLCDASGRRGRTRRQRRM